LKPASAGSGAEIYGTTVQIANVAGVAATGAVFWPSKPPFSGRPALFASLAPVCALDCRLWRIFVVDAARLRRGSIKIDRRILGTDSTRSFYFAVQQLSVLGGVGKPSR
jgi:hypothetical protein